MNISKILAILTLVSTAGAASAQGVFGSGFLHTTVGGATTLTAEGRKIRTCCIGSSGQDGVEVKFRTSQGAGLYVDLTPLAESTPGVTKVIRTKYKGWDGTIKGRMMVSGSFSDGHVQEQCDFSTLGPPGTFDVQVTCRTRAGDIIALPLSHSPLVSWTTFISYGPGEQMGQGLSAGKVSFSDLSIMIVRTTDRPARLEFLINGAVQVVSDVVEVSFRPICIVAPCPGDFTNLESIIVTGLGMNEISVYDASFRSQGENPLFEPKPDLRTFASGAGHIAEQCCADLDGDGVADRVIVVSNIGSSGQDGVSVEFPPSTAGARRKWGNGHVTLMKFTDEIGSEMRMTSVKDPLACTSTFTPDFDSLGATQFMITLRDQFGNALDSQVLDAGQYFTVLGACSTPLNSTMEVRKAGTEQREYLKIDLQTVHVVTLSNGVALAGVKSCEAEPLNPRARFGDLATWTTTSLGGDIYLGEVEVIPSTPPCPADFNGDGAVDFFDYLDFVDAFSIGC